MKAFRAPGFVEGTFGLECLLDELAARLDVDPLELRRRNYARLERRHARTRRRTSRECYRRAEPHWERRARGARPLRRGLEARRRDGEPDLVRRRRAALATRGCASAPTGARRSITAMQDIGTGTRTAMAQIAAEELGLPLERVDVVARRLRARAVRRRSRPAPRRRRRWARPCARRPPTRSGRSSRSRRSATSVDERVLDVRDGAVVSADGELVRRSRRSSACSSDAQILGKGARGPNPTGMSVLTFGVQVAEVAVDVETGEVRVERVAAIHDVGRDRSTRSAPSSQVEGGIIQGDRPHALGGAAARPGDGPRPDARRSTRTGCRRSPTCRRSSCEFVDRPDEHLTNLGSKGLGEPPIVPIAAAIANAIRDATGADVHELPISREEMLRALREAATREGEGAAWSSCGRLASTSSPAARLRSPAAPRSCRCSATGCCEAERARRRPRRRAARDRRDGVDRRRDDARRARGDPRRSRTRCARRAGSPRRRSCATWARVGGNLLQSTRCWYWRLDVPVPAARRRPLPRARGRAPRARDLRERLLRLGASRPTSRPRCVALGARAAHEPPRAAGRGAVPAPGRGRPAHDDARGRRADPRARACRRPRRAST